VRWMDMVRGQVEICCVTRRELLIGFHNPNQLRIRAAARQRNKAARMVVSEPINCELNGRSIFGTRWTNQCEEKGQSCGKHGFHT
jgi:hypothetical protein